MLRPVRLVALYMRLGALNELQYRANFFVALFQSALAVAVGLAVLALVYSHTPSLNGWSHSELMIVLGVQILLGGVIHAMIAPNMQQLMDEVRDGKLDFALTKPEDSQLIVSFRSLQLWQLTEVVSGACVVAVGITRLDGGVGAGDAAMFLLLLVVGALLVYCFWLVLATLAFWLVNTWFLSEAFEGIYQVGRWPIGMYPGWLRYSMTYLVPIGFAVTVPAQAVTHRLGWQTAVVAFVFAAAFVAFARWFFRTGLRRYAGASA
jgi:viologen exporter family transport system permease protein